MLTHLLSYSNTQVTNLLGGKAPGRREYVVLSREQLAQSVHVAREQVLATNLHHAGKMVDFLPNQPSFVTT